MSRRVMQGLGLRVIAAVLSFSVMAAAADAADEKAAAETKTKKARAEARGYLPPYYKNVVDGVQREKIYKIQSQYEAKMDELEKQLKAMADQRDAEIEGVLTPEQKQRIKELAAEAKTKRAKKPDVSAEGTPQGTTAAPSEIRPTK
ncbi:MAG TPA: hypothetical protein VG713_16985 [Pirellulales bacterium]|nr:hypothetical protein [Pirellulales bacterium]